MPSTLSFRANWIWTGLGEPERNRCITIQNGRIVSVSAETPASAIDLGPFCILPGLINSHTHLEFSGLRQPISAGNSFADWILRVVQRRQTTDSSTITSIEKETLSIDGLLESKAHAVRLIFDVVHPSEPLRILPFKPISDEKEWANPTTVRFAELMATTEARRIQTWKASFKLKKKLGGRHLFGLSPHAPYTTTSGMIRQAVARCNRWNVPIMMHLAESLDEMRWVARGDGPLQDLLEVIAGPDVLSTSNRLSIAGYVHELCQAPLAFVVHGNYLDEPSMRILGARRQHAAVVYCPRTHEHFGHPRYPLMELRRHGIPVVLGTDSRASNPDLSIFEEARSVRRLFPELTAPEIIAMTTTLPADLLLGFENDWGYIRPGYRDRLTAVPCQARRSEDVLEELLTSRSPVRPLEAVLDCV